MNSIRPHILLFGTGRSSYFLISYLHKQSQSGAFDFTITDGNQEIINERTKEFSGINSKLVDVTNESERQQAISVADCVISLLPPALHYLVAEDCIKLKKHLCTASYVSKEIAALSDAAKAADLIFLNECGLDPGIDHMSAMRLLDEIKAHGGKIKSFESYTGGLVAPESDTNPWGYKISWNPMNVVLAGQSTALYWNNNHINMVPYSRVFSDIKVFDLKEKGQWEGYPNRDSLAYIDLYKLQGVERLIRGTLRKPGYCKTWNLLVQLGITMNDHAINTENISYIDWLTSYSKVDPKQYFKTIGAGEDDMLRLESLGLFSGQMINKGMQSSAQILLGLMIENWKLAPEDKDLIVMVHRGSYVLNGELKYFEASLYQKGWNAEQTAMAYTVGMPLAIGAELIVSGKIKSRGIQIPLTKEFYEPILSKLELEGLVLEERVGLESLSL